MVPDPVPEPIPEPHAEPTPEPEPAGQRRGIDGWSVLHGVGEVLITVGCILLLFAAYELIWTNVTADRHEAGVRHALVQSFEQPSGAPSSKPGASAAGSQLPATTTTQPGHAFAVMYIPALGAHWARAVVEGVELSDLRGT